MKLFKAVVALVILLNFAIAQPSWADRPNLTTNLDYTEVTQAIGRLLRAKNNPESDYKPEEIEQKLGELKLQKYILETAVDWGQYRNETGKTLTIYAHKPKESNFEENTLFFLGNGQITDDDWNCDGVYLPSGVKVAGLQPVGTQVQELTEPLALKLVPGTQLIAKSNLDNAVEFNITPAKVFKVGEGNWSIPNLSLTDIDIHVPNAPIDD